MNARDRGRRTVRVLTGALVASTVIGSGVGAAVLWQNTSESKASAAQSSTDTGSGSSSSGSGLVAPSRGGSTHGTTRGS